MKGLINITPSGGNANSNTFINRFLEPDAVDLCSSDPYEGMSSKWLEKHRDLTYCIGRVLEDYSLVKFAPLNIKDEDSIQTLLLIIDNCIQFGEDADVKTHEFEEPDENDDGYNDDS